MSDKITTRVTANDDQLNNLDITVSLRMKLGEWDQVHNALSHHSLSGVARPMSEMIGRLQLALRTRHSTVPNPGYGVGLDTPEVSAEYDSDDLLELLVLMRFTYKLAQWRSLMEQLKGKVWSGPMQHLYQTLVAVHGQLENRFTVHLVKEEEAL